MPPSDNKFANAFSFGGGYKNGGISDEGMEVIRKLFRFDYMGSAEFEWGAVPKAMEKIVDNRKDFELWTVDVVSNMDVSATIYVIANPDWKEEINKNLKAFAKRSKNMPRTKVAVNLDIGINKRYSWNPDYEIAEHMLPIGWLELDNGYFFFTDENIAMNTALTFGIGEK